MKSTGIIFSVISFIILVIPTIIVLPFLSTPKEQVTKGKDVLIEKKGEDVTPKKSSIVIPVYRTLSKQVENIPLEEYVIGVVASEMPARFDLESLKAQALTTRTYIVKLMSEENSKVVNSPEKSLVDDTKMFQVYKNKQELQKLWGKEYKWKMTKITEAVSSTQGQIITYNDKPIDATFFSTGNGFTENSEEYWKSKIPYLRSVVSPGDKSSPEFKNTKVISIDQFEKKLGVTLPNDGSVGEITSRTQGKRVASVSINGKKFTGKEIRDQLNLMSSDFDWNLKNGKVSITTKGYGHGVGMSQYGAEGMAKEGKSYKEIISHYYNGVEIENSDKYLTRMTASRKNITRNKK